MTTRKIGASTLRVRDNMPRILRMLEERKRRAALAMAEEAKMQAVAVYNSDGDGSWANHPNSPATVAWKGHNKIMLGRTGTLSDDVEIRISPVKPDHWAVGWFQDDHPDSALSKAGLAWQHEATWPWLSKVEDNPIRAEAVYAVGRRVYLGGL